VRRGIDPPFWWKPWLHLYPLLEWRRRPRTVRKPWHKNRQDVEVAVTETAASIWAHDQESGQEWCSPLSEHRNCCLPRVLDRLEAETIPHADGK